MERSEDVKVGLFVVGAVVLLVLALVLVGGLNLFQQPRNRYTVRTHFAGGIEEGAPVRYAGMKVGRVDRLALDPQDPSRAVISVSVYPETPVRTDSSARVTSLGMLGENYIEITPGEDPQAQPLPSGSEIPAKDSVQWGELVDQFGGATDEAKALLQEARPRVRQALDNINDLTDEENRRRVRSALARMDQILTDSQPRVKTVLTNFESSSAKIDKFMDDIKVTRANLDELLKNWSSLAGGDQAEVQLTLQKLRDTLARGERAMEEIQRLLEANRENLDVTLENIRMSSENVREISDTVKQRPSSLIWSKNPPDRRPGEPPKK
jgi:phospholipid/cholesterol/gamma-HCH transport system substrate-binding protein